MLTSQYQITELPDGRGEAVSHHKAWPKYEECQSLNSFDDCRKLLDVSQ